MRQVLLFQIKIESGEFKSKMTTQNRCRLYRVSLNLKSHNITGFKSFSVVLERVDFTVTRFVARVRSSFLSRIQQNLLTLHKHECFLSVVATGGCWHNGPSILYLYVFIPKYIQYMCCYSLMFLHMIQESKELKRKLQKTTTTTIQK